MESNSKTTLLYILEDLLEEEFTKFKFQLTNIAISEEYHRIPRSTLHQASRVKLADLLIQFYGDEYSRIVTKEVLITIDQRNLAEKLCQGIEKRESTPNLHLCLLDMTQDFFWNLHILINWIYTETA